MGAAEYCSKKGLIFSGPCDRIGSTHLHLFCCMLTKYAALADGIIKESFFMTSWRNNASQQAQDDLDALFNDSLNAAIHFLNKNKAFSPFALTSSIEDKPALVAVGHEKEFPDSQSIISYLISSLQSTNDNYKAIGIIADVSIDQGKNSAIRISLEHRENIAIEIIVPYSIHGIIRKEIKIGEFSASSIENFIWILK